MLREARVVAALRDAGARVPRVVLVCGDDAVLGVPFYVMDYLDGVVVTDRLPAALDTAQDRRRLGLDLVDALAEIHAVDWRACGLADFGRPDGYLQRQVRRFAALWEHNKTRELPPVADLAAALDRGRPEPADATVVHGDYRLGNAIVRSSPPARILAVVDWELSTIGDPLADVGYLIATYSDAASPRTPLELSPVTRSPGFPTRAELVERYASITRRAVGGLGWYEALALWKAAVFCEAIYARYLRGERNDPFSRSLADGVPALLEAASDALARA
jgi:aminoglycoside phosphotransferase (APT) family kinase protein